MKWLFAEIKKGRAYPNKLFWQEKADTLIPIPDSVYNNDCNVTEDKIQLYWRDLKSGSLHPLLWVNDDGTQECAINIQEWLENMKIEAYRREHEKPLSAKLPFHYHRIPSPVRNLVLAATIWLKRNNQTDKDMFPRSMFNFGCEILMECSGNNVSRMNKPTLVLTHDIDTEHGFRWVKEIAKIEENFVFHSSWNVVPMSYKINHGILHRLLEDGHEIGMHGLWHNNREAFLGEEKMRSEFNSQKEFMKEFSIEGYRSPSWYRTSTMFKVLSQFFLYDMSCLDIDFICPGGGGGVGFVHPFKLKSGLVELPCTLPFEAPLFFGITPDNLVDYWMPKIDFLKATNGTLLVNTHPDPHYLGNNLMLFSYEKLLKTLADSNWQNTLPGKIARNMN